MMLGNVAPAPFSVTCAAAGTAAPSSAARASNRVSFMSSSLRVALERELCLEQGLRARRLERRRRRAALVREQVQVGEQPQVRRELIRGAADDACLAIVAGVGVGVHKLHASDYTHLAVPTPVHCEYPRHS